MGLQRVRHNWVIKHSTFWPQTEVIIKRKQAGGYSHLFWVSITNSTWNGPFLHVDLEVKTDHGTWGRSEGEQEKPRQKSASLGEALLLFTGILIWTTHLSSSSPVLPCLAHWQFPSFRPLRSKAILCLHREECSHPIQTPGLTLSFTNIARSCWKDMSVWKATSLRVSTWPPCSKFEFHRKMESLPYYSWSSKVPYPWDEKREEPTKTQLR